MALQATHLLIARDLIPRLKIQDSLVYYSGTLYPDSRYLTGISRHETHHGANCPRDPSREIEEFRKGWGVHLSYDSVGGEQQKSFIPLGKQLSSSLDDAWAAFTAAKIVEDIRSASLLEQDLSLIQQIPCPKPPLNEDPALLKNHYTALQRLYRNGVPRVMDYEAHFLRIPHMKGPTRLVMNHVHNILGDPRLRARAEAVYTSTSLYLRSTL